MNVFDLPDGYRTEMTDDEERQLVAMLGPAADSCPLEGRLSTMPNFMPRGNIYNLTGCEKLQEPGWVVSQRRSPIALPVLLEIFTKHASREARLAAGHFVLAYPGSGADVAELAVERAKELVGWFRLWAGAQLAISTTEAYVAIADRVASATGETRPLLDAAMDAGWHAKVTDPRWGDLAMMTLEKEPRHYAALSVLSTTQDRRGIPLLLEEIRHPDLGTASLGCAGSRGSSTRPSSSRSSSR